VLEPQARTPLVTRRYFLQTVEELAPSLWVRGGGVRPHDSATSRLSRNCAPRS